MKETKGPNPAVLLPLLQEMPAYQRLVEQGSRVKVSVLESAKPYVVTALHQTQRQPLLLVTGRPERARRLYEQLLAWGAESLFFFPEPDALPYERLTPDFTTTQERLETLAALTQDVPPPLVVAPAWAVAQKTIHPEEFRQACHTLAPGMSIDLSQLLGLWQRLGYQMETAVEVPGTASRRGGILDIFPLGSPRPVRIELVGNQIESLRHFDPATQRSQELVDSIQIIPAREVLLPPPDEANTLQGFQTALRLAEMPEQGREHLEEELAWLLQGKWFPGQELYASLFNTGCLLDYLPAGAWLIWDETAEIEAALAELDIRASELRRLHLASGELSPGFPIPYFTWAQLQERSSARLELTRWDGEESGDLALAFSPAPSYGGQWAPLIRWLQQQLRQKQAVVIVSQQAPRIFEILQEENIIASRLPHLTQPPSPGSLSLVQGSLSGGWTMDTARHRLTLLTDNEVFNFVKQRRWVKHHPVRRQAFLSELTPGDYVVHIDHGIARFTGMAHLGPEGEESEYIVLEYAESDRLYVPTDQVGRVSRYIGPGGAPLALSRLGTQEWQRTKQRVQEAVGAIAQELLELYAAREVVSGLAYSPDTPWQQELEASFPYVETPDQLQAVLQVKADMEKPRPMDRLVCGDVGYGKTEVAIRAAFKAVMDSRQVAVLVPTTVLAQQHFNTFRQRLAAFPIRVEMLSRFRSPKEQHEVLAGLAQGSVDIVIGTHRLLQRDVAFKNLGLVVIDEEQRFGVAHKEKLKKMRQEVDVLTLSATPIPRTFYMSLVGVRDMSLMETPPEERLPIKTYVAEYDERLVREAILREMERNGQVFFVHNRVQTIGRMAGRLREIVPEARIAIGHGQMDEAELEQVMADFAQGGSDVLACSTIIESGLDIPNVNTLIVNDADRFGLTQLYQLRGRVGRGAHRAYAYFLYSKGKVLTEPAQKRLGTIFEATELGAGFRIAMKDLEIRGAGNLLGVEQSGHIGAVGFDLYSQLLAEAVEILKAKHRGEPVRPTSHPPSPTIHLPFTALIPPDYMPDVSSRLAFYQRLTQVATDSGVADMAGELRDRFGSLPPEVENLLYLVRVKAMAQQVGVADIVTEEGDIVLKLMGGVRLEQGCLGPLPAGVRLGHTQVRLQRQGRVGWRVALERLLKLMAA